MLLRLKNKHLFRTINATDKFARNLVEKRNLTLSYIKNTAVTITGTVNMVDGLCNFVHLCSLAR